MTTLDLSRLPWRLIGWRPYAWMSANTAEVGALARSEVGPVPARVPGSVQEALRRAGALPDWNRGLNAQSAEWVEHRHWEFCTDLPAGALPVGERVLLCADGLDHHGWIRVDGRGAGRFSGALLRHRLDLSAWLNDGGAHRLQIISDALWQQAQALAVAAGACKARFPRCGGILIWMGHDCFPCPVNTAIIDFEGRPKPAYRALKRVFRAVGKKRRSGRA